MDSTLPNIHIMVRWKKINNNKIKTQNNPDRLKYGSTKLNLIGKHESCIIGRCADLTAVHMKMNGNFNSK